VIFTGVGGKNLKFHPEPEPSSAANILSFTAIIAGFTISYAGCGMCVLKSAPQALRQIDSQLPISIPICELTLPLGPCLFILFQYVHVTELHY
jgi:hypothetical protein